MLSENIKSYRKLKGWTQEKMAIEFKISRDNVASYERGLAKPSLEFACQICDDIKISLHEFLYGEVSNILDRRDQTEESFVFTDKNNTIGQRIRHIRIILDKKSTVFAELIGTDKDKLMLYESGFEIPDKLIIAKVCRLFGITPIKFFKTFYNSHPKVDPDLITNEDETGLSIAAETQTQYGTDWKNKYYECLEKYNNLLEANQDKKTEREIG